MIPVFIIVASFGPYVFPSYGLRSEHFLVYPLLLLAVPVFLMRQHFFYLYKPILEMLVLLLGITLWTMIVSLSGDYVSESSYKFISSLENYIQPTAIIIVVLTFVSYASYASFLYCFQRLCWVLILLLCLNSVVAFASIFWNLSNFIQPFVEGCFRGSGTSVSHLAWTMGRYSGIFNQPVESGLTYSLGLLSWGYLSRICMRIDFTNYCTLFMLIVGGILSVSKVFILGGMPLFILYLNPMRNFRKYFSWRFVLTAIIGYYIVLSMVPFWSGWDFFLRLFKLGESNTNLIYLYTAGRFGIQGAGVQSTFAKVWQEAPLQGFGFGVSSLLDNGYLEFFLQGGMVALLGYFALLGIFFQHCLRGFLNGYEEGRLLLAFFVLVVGGSLGAPVLTINRFSTIFWVLNTFLFLMLQIRRRDKVNNRIILDQTLRVNA